MKTSSINLKRTLLALLLAIIASVSLSGCLIVPGHEDHGDFHDHDHEFHDHDHDDHH